MNPQDEIQCMTVWIVRFSMARALKSAGLGRFVFVLLCASPLTGHTDCWTINTISGESISTSDLWQIRSRITGTSELIGAVNGLKTSVSLADVAELTINQPGERSEFDLHIRLLNAQTFILRSDMDLYYLIEDEKKKKRPIRLADISAVNRCPDDADTNSTVIPAAAGAATLAPAPSFNLPEINAVVVTTSGDILNGELTDDEILWQTSYGEITFRPEFIKLIIGQCGPDQTGLLETFSGDRLSGTMADQPISMRLSTGQTLSVPTKQIKYIDRSEIRSGNLGIVAHCNNEQD